MRSIRKTAEGPTDRRGFECLSRCWLIGGLLVTSLLLVRVAAEWTSGKPTVRASPECSTASHYVARNIERIRVGDRVVTDVTDEIRELALGETKDRPWWDADEVEPAKWRCLQLTAPLSDEDRVDIVLLRPLAWIEQIGVTAGETIHISLPEQGIDGPVRVVSIGACPPIKSGRGSVVTGTFTHVRGGILELYLDSLDQTVGVTENHLVYSLDREEFIPAGQIRLGERLRQLEGATRLMEIRRLPGEQRVYNIEVHATHVYHVTALGILVHNISALADDAPPKKIYRTGRPGRPQDVTARPQDNGKTSFRDSISNPAKKPDPPAKPPLRDTIIEVDTDKLPRGTVHPDGGTIVDGQLMPEGHVSVTATPGEIVDATTGSIKLP